MLNTDYDNFSKSTPYCKMYFVPITNYSRYTEPVAFLIY